jgi:hypothetical protein
MSRLLPGSRQPPYPFRYPGDPALKEPAESFQVIIRYWPGTRNRPKHSGKFIPGEPLQRNSHTLGFLAGKAISRIRKFVRLADTPDHLVPSPSADIERREVKPVVVAKYRPFVVQVVQPLLI